MSGLFLLRVCVGLWALVVACESATQAATAMPASPGSSAEPTLPMDGLIVAEWLIIEDRFDALVDTPLRAGTRKLIDDLDIKRDGVTGMLMRFQDNARSLKQSVSRSREEVSALRDTFLTDPALNTCRGAIASLSETEKSADRLVAILEGVGTNGRAFLHREAEIMSATDDLSAGLEKVKPPEAGSAKAFESASRVFLAAQDAVVESTDAPGAGGSTVTPDALIVAEWMVVDERFRTLVVAPIQDNLRRFANSRANAKDSATPEALEVFGSLSHSITKSRERMLVLRDSLKTQIAVSVCDRLVADLVAAEKSAGELTMVLQSSPDPTELARQLESGLGMVAVHGGTPAERSKVVASAWAVRAGWPP